MNSDTPSGNFEMLSRLNKLELELEIPLELELEIPNL